MPFLPKEKEAAGPFPMGSFLPGKGFFMLSGGVFYREAMARRAKNAQGKAACSIKILKILKIKECTKTAPVRLFYACCAADGEHCFWEKSKKAQPAGKKLQIFPYGLSYTKTEKQGPT